MKQPAQRWLILSWLTMGPVCGTTMHAANIGRYGGRLHELRKRGWLIDKRPCENLNHSHTTRQQEYFLENSPGVMTPTMAAVATPGDPR
jgi:hypothetical protein